MIGGVSVVIAHYNRAKYLKQALQSIIRQTVIPKEILVVDDASRLEQQENAKALCKDFGAHFISRKINGGPSAARNDGIQASTAEWFQILDSDDCLTRNSLEVRLQALSDNRNALWVAGQCAMAKWFLPSRSRQSEITNKLPWLRLKKETVIEPNDVSDEDPFKIKWIHCTMLLHRSLFEKYGLYDETLRHGEDKELRWRFFHFSQTLPLVVDDIVYIYRHGHGDRLSTVKNHQFVLSQIQKRKLEGLTPENTAFLKQDRIPEDLL